MALARLFLLFRRFWYPRLFGLILLVGGGAFLAEGEYATGLFGVMVGVTLLLWPLLPSGSKPFVATVPLSFWFLGGYLFWDWDSGDYTVAALIAGIVAFFFATGSWGRPRRASRPPAFSSSADPNAEAFAAYRFPAYPRAVHLCQQRAVST